MITPRLFRLELMVAVSVCWLFLQQKSAFSVLSRSLKIFHFCFILIYALIGTAGLHTLIAFCFGNSRFVETFQQSNLLSIPSETLYWIALFYGLIGSVFFFSVLSLCHSSRKGRTVFLLLAASSTVLYPVIMGNLTGTSEILRSSHLSAQGVLIVFAAIAVSGICFYFLPPMSREVLKKTLVAREPLIKAPGMKGMKSEDATHSDKRGLDVS
jgi:hypothetical protein